MNAGRVRRVVVTPASAPDAQVRPGWLLGALALLLLTALCFAYLSLCLLFAQGQWQMLYRPSAAITATPASVGLGFTEVRFGTTEAGVAELSGWWLPAAADASLEGTTVVYLHDGAGSLSEALPELVRIHALGCSVFAIDYRGYGASAVARPSEAKMVEDAQRAITYLLDTRHLQAGSLVLWGRGIGATIAAEASLASAANKPGERLPVVMDDVSEPALVLLRADPRTRWLPVRLLLRDRLDAETAVRGSDGAKLFLGGSNMTQELYNAAAGPKQQLGPWNGSSNETAAVQAFLKDAGAGRH
jgi:pimeloyl-ACP methyl ester carboxylesterase